jgi:flagellar protein FliS
MMLFEGFLERVAQAKGAIQQKNIEMRGKKINDASSILLGLKDSLDLEKGGEVAQNLDALYDYVGRTLMQAHMKTDEDLLDECGRLIAPVASAWREMGAKLNS